MISKIGALRAANGGADPLAFFPDFSRGFASETVWTLPVITFLVYLGVQWWAFWYPGAEPGGGGYIAQRIFSARSEREGIAFRAVVQHRALRAASVAMDSNGAGGDCALNPGLEHPESSYMMIVNEHVPHALRGVVLAGFLAAFMSTIATQLNWGTLVSGGGFLPALFAAGRERAALRACVADRDAAAGGGDGLCFGAACVDSERDGRWCWNWARGAAAFICCDGIGGGSMRGARFRRWVPRCASRCCCDGMDSGLRFCTGRICLRDRARWCLRRAR